MARAVSAKVRKATATVRTGGQAKYPMPDKKHARLALQMIDQAKPPLTAAQEARVRARANAMLGTSGKKR